MRTEDLRMWAAADVGELGIRAELPAVGADAVRALARFDEAGAAVTALDGPAVDALGYEMSGSEALLDLDSLALAARSAWELGGQEALDAAAAWMRTTEQEGASPLAWANALLQADEVPYEPYRFPGASPEERFGRGVLADAVETAPVRWPTGIAASARRGDELAAAVLGSIDCERYGQSLRGELPAGRLGYLACPAELGEASIAEARSEMDCAPPLAPGKAEAAAARLADELGWEFDPAVHAPGDLAVLDALSRASTPEGRDAARTWAGSLELEGRDEAAALAAALEEPGMVGYVAYSEAARARYPTIEGRLGFDASRDAPLPARWPDYIDAAALGREVALVQGWELCERGACAKDTAEAIPLDFYGREDVVAFVRGETSEALPGRDASGVPVPAAELVDMEAAVMPPRPRPRPATPLEEAEWIRSQRKGGGGGPGSGPPAPAMELPPPEPEWTAVHGIGEGTLPEPTLPGERRPAPRPARSVEGPRSPAEERARLKGADKAQGREGPKPPPSRAR